MIKLGNTDFNGGYIGSAQIQKLYLGNTLVWEQGEKRLEYISNGGSAEATRNVCFDTGVEPSFDLTFEVRFSSEHLNGTQAIAACTDAVDNYYQILAPRGNGGYAVQCKQNVAESPYRVMTADVHTIRAYSQNNHNVCEVDGTTTYTATGTEKILPEAGIAMGLFARRTATGFAVNCYGSTKIYYFKVWDGSTLLHDFEPYLKNGTPCFKDLVTGIYIYNIGIDTPVAGPEWQPESEIHYSAAVAQPISGFETVENFGDNLTLISNTYATEGEYRGSAKYRGIVTKIGARAFYQETYLVSIVIPDSVTIIDDWAFYWNTQLYNVTIGKGVTRIGEGAFADCDRLTSITCLASTPPDLGLIAFGSTPVVQHIYVPAGSVNAYKRFWGDFENIIEAIPTE